MISGIMKGQRIYEDYAYVLDHLPQGYTLDFKILRRGESIVQVIGENYFILLELIAKPEAAFSVGERVYIGKEGRNKISRVKRRISYNDLTSIARDNLPAIIEKIVEINEKKFVNFFNEAEAITTRLHALELLPKIGKKLMWSIIEERKREPFRSFQDIRERIGIDAKKVIIERILREISSNEKYYLFVKKT
mgnify:CR=1 FL=1